MRWKQVKTFNFAVENNIIGIYLINKTLVNAGLYVL
jgi:hypothetical protein